MYFDFQDNHPDLGHIPRASGWRDWILLLQLAFAIHVLVIVGIMSIPPLDRRAVEARIAQQMQLQRERERNAERFVFVQPHLDMPATRRLSPRAEPSDKDRNAQARERARNPTNPMPFARGNTPEKVESLRPPTPPPQRAEPQSQQMAGPTTPSQQPSNDRSAEAGSPPPASTATGSLVLPSARAGNGQVPNAPGLTGMGAGRGLVGNAMRELQQYVKQEGYDNQGGGGGQPGASIQFDTKGVDFGSWLRRFVAQIRRNWFIPYAAMAMKGHVVVTFYIAKDGRISQLAVPGPSNVDAFNNAAYNAMATSNPTYPLPPEYPSDRAFFTVTFYYNETPPGGGY